jgi:hypothetical protein
VHALNLSIRMFGRKPQHAAEALKHVNTAKLPNRSKDLIVWSGCNEPDSQVYILIHNQVHAYSKEIQCRFFRKQSLKWKRFIPYFQLIFSCTVTPFRMSSILEYPVYTVYMQCLYIQNIIVSLSVNESNYLFCNE